jgi:ubiquinone/menaquinone biosynthesis C-methylase UbiE
MKMNAIERLCMNNPVRAMIQRRYEAPLLEDLGGRVDGMRVLEVGCGQGVGTEIILERFGAARVESIDVDPIMVARARRRLRRYPAERVSIAQGDATSLDAEDERFDAVFDFWILHHVPDWQSAVSEIRRVLRPGGRFFFQEVTDVALAKRFYRWFLDHPADNRFGADRFVAELERQGISVAGNTAIRGGGDFVFGVGRRDVPSGDGAPSCDSSGPSRTGDAGM